MFRKLFFALLIVPLLTTCGPVRTSTPVAVSTKPPASTVPADTSISLTDGLNRTVTLAGPAQRVVSLAPSNTEILFAVGAGAQVVGRDETSDYPAEALSLPTIGGYSGFNLEAIVALHPDLVLAGGINTPELVASLEQLGLTVYFLPNPATLEEMYTNLETVARLSGHESETTKLVESLKVRVDAVDEKIRRLSYAPTVYYELDATEPTKPFTAGPGSFVDLLIARAGGVNVGAELQGQWAQISMEQLVVANPAIIILGDAAYGETPEKVAQRPGWGTLTAIQTGQVFTFDDNLVSRPGPRLVDGLEALAKLLHPGVFKVMNTPTIASPFIHEVKIEVIGTMPNTVDVTYTDLEGGGTAQETHKSLPWWRSWTGIPDGTFVYISAQNNSDNGSITCNIYVDGNLWKTAKSNGAYVICDASGDLGSK